MATAKDLDREDSVGGRPQRPLKPPQDAPDSPVMPDTPLTPGEKQALEAERHQDEGSNRVRRGGLPEIPHGDDNAGKPPIK
jgi:hypothetical protein